MTFKRNMVALRDLFYHDLLAEVVHDILVLLHGVEVVQAAYHVPHSARQFIC